MNPQLEQVLKEEHRRYVKLMSPYFGLDYTPEECNINLNGRFTGFMPPLVLDPTDPTLQPTILMKKKSKYLGLTDDIYSLSAQYLYFCANPSTFIADTNINGSIREIINEYSNLLFFDLQGVLNKYIKETKNLPYYQSLKPTHEFFLKNKELLPLLTHAHLGQFLQVSNPFIEGELKIK